MLEDAWIRLSSGRVVIDTTQPAGTEFVVPQPENFPPNTDNVDPFCLLTLQAELRLHMAPLFFQTNAS